MQRGQSELRGTMSQNVLGLTRDSLWPRCILAESGSHFGFSALLLQFSKFSLSGGRRGDKDKVVMKIAVIGSGISGAVCAAALARGGFMVTVFEMGRGPGGRMSQRREITEDGRELLFDHGAPCFTVKDKEVKGIVSSWEARGLVAEWKENFGIFDFTNSKFLQLGEEGVTSKKYVGVPGMNSICKALCLEPGVEPKFGVTVGRLEWLENNRLWALSGLDGQNLGSFDGVVASDKNIVSTRFTGLTGRPPPLDVRLVPDLAVKLQDVPVHSCFALMLAFSEPLSSIPVKGFSFLNSDVLNWAACDSCKPGRGVASDTSECWVLHSTSEYAEGIIRQTGLQKPSHSTLTKVAEDIFKEFQSTGLDIPQPFFMKAHRWGSAFPAVAVTGEEKCLFDKTKRLVVCGDFCASPTVEGAILSGSRAAKKLQESLSSL
ncbi:hypothetical protein H6P81_019817 [Aristolochia fimbriata]|uniref:Amine oxidase domain-containing protein n=1 Tax=Aristolochia fimbriata TaxID=158543 RepID=A0AAV7DW06_ARIFI|nr:hypothetical protein H6P81_019817 [Aristolochia fimbriata]